MLKKRCIFFIVVSLTLIFIGCNDKKGNVEPEVSKAKFSMEETLILDENSKSFYTIDNHKLKAKELAITDEEILCFNKDTLVTAINSKNGEDIILYKGNKVYKTSFIGELEYFNFNKEASKAIYKLKSKDDEYEYGILDLLTSKTSKIDMDIAISGNLIEFINDSNLIFYGASKTEKVSGIYRYNIETKEVNLIKGINNGFITYIKPISEECFIYLLSNFNDEKVTFKYNINNSKEYIVSKDITKIKDILEYKDQIFMIGSLKNNLFSLYGIKDNKVNRLVYDFPRGISDDSNIIQVNERIVFEGYDKNQEKNNLFEYNLLDKSTNIISNNDGKYRIIKKSDKY
ncbi:hypothetical protein SAMN02745163_02242 [Clostridium cavendishii DSM 21758]|uniref:Lipoprotein n=1 Tax=Clostridium cavendishii DSM 21758 TaxID=1121302 RepID=A0A1M6KMR0_9CLOT|nr:hypothetical protein [Clostridium cavendishii]SHJ60210.1 hypothetical protein SAMN02745163_02242 [Clostridium cavendishii DSM 21758]